MYSKRSPSPPRNLFYFLTVLAVSSSILFFINARTDSTSVLAKGVPSTESAQAVFSNTTPITIPATIGNGSPYPSTINVTGMIGNISNTPGSVKVTINNFSHTFNSDVIIALVGPGGQALMIQGRAGLGQAENNVTYTLSDTGATFVPDPVWGPGTYKPTNWALSTTSFPAPGPGTAWQDPGNPDTPGPATFSSVFGSTSPNGNWNLYVRDPFDLDGGAIAGGWTLELTTVGGPPVSDTLGDYDADGKSDFAVIRSTGGINGQATWYVSLNSDSTMHTTEWGIATDWFIPGDFDGDQKDDYAIWRPGSQSKFYIIQSITNTIRVEDWGTASDNPSVIGDYDNDGKEDFAVYRPGAAPGAQSFWYWRPSAIGASGFNVVPWGINGDTPAPGDYDGDGKMDFAVQRSGVFYRLFTSGISISQTPFGNPNDFVVPGDYDGDGKSDLCVVGASSAFTSEAGEPAMQWTYRPSSGGPDVVQNWGFINDTPVPGDYNGDGRSDFAIWRFGALSTFWILRSNTYQIESRQWGLLDDIPVNFTFVN